METLTLLQGYWWLIVAVLGGILVFLLFVQGGQSMLLCNAPADQRQLMVNSLGRKWEFTYTTLAVFGGGFFASFPLFYSTSFGGAYWLWMLILLSFVVQAFSYEFRRKRGNIYGTRFYDTLLFCNGLFGCVLLGVAVGMFFFGAEFTVAKTNILDAGAPVISQWAPTHGLEAIASWRNLLLGLTVFFLARTLAALYFINNIGGNAVFTARMRRSTLVNGLIFAVLFVTFVVVLFLTPGYRMVPGQPVMIEPNIYLHNYLSMWWLAVVFLLGVLLVLGGIFGTALSSTWRGGIWPAGAGVFAVIVTLFCVAGFADTAYLPSTVDPASSLTIANSSSSQFTLTVMSWVSILIPFVLAYIWYVWRKMNATQLTEKELENESHAY